MNQGGVFAILLLSAPLTRDNPFLPLHARSPLRSSPSTLIACFYITDLSTAGPRWYSKRFSSSAEVAAASSFQPQDWARLGIRLGLSHWKQLTGSC